MPRALKVCPCVGCDAHPGSCPTLVASGRCTRCARVADAKRGRRQARGYGKAHDDARDQLLRDYTPGQPCPKCGEPQWNPALLDAGHSVDLRIDPDAVADQLECRPCNRAWRRGQ